jgi:hypothetical protein
MSSSFIIPERAYEGFRDLIDLGPDKITHLAKEVTGYELTLDTSELARKLGATVGLPRERMEHALHTVLIPLNSLRMAFRQSPKEFLQLLGQLIAKQNPDWHAHNGEQWQKIAPKIEPLLAPDSFFCQLSKTFQLLANRPTVARGLKILTELRPVFNDELSSTRAMVLTNTLVVEYEEGDNSRTLHLTIDQADLRLLQEQLDRAEKKIQLLEEQVKKLGVPILIAGTERE